VRAAVAIALSIAVTSSAAPAHRIVSLIPAVTEMLFALGAGDAVVGVSRFDRYPPEVSTRPSVGGLVDPDVERILALRPTLVVLYETQVELRTRLDRAGIQVFEYRHGSIADIFDTIDGLGARVDRAAEARALTRRMHDAIADVTTRVRQEPRVPTLFVVGRDPGALRHVYVAGGQAFLNELVDLAGGVNVFSDIAHPAAEVSTEQILARRPDVVVELWPNRKMDERTRQVEIAAWNSLSSVPAVRLHRIVEIADDRLAIPGPRLPQGLRTFAEALHPALLQQRPDN